MKKAEQQFVIDAFRQLENEDERFRLRRNLRILHYTVITLTIVALLVMLIPPFAHPFYYAIVLVSLFINGLVEWLMRTQREQAGAITLIVWMNLGIWLILSANGLGGDLLRMTQFAATTPLFVVIASLLLGWRFSGALTIVNLVFIFVAYLVFFTLFPTDRGLFKDTTSLFIPLLLYFVLLWAAVSFYQRLLAESRQRLNQARAQLMHDQILRHDLEIAHALQRRMYPRLPAQIGNVQIAARSEAARETSGDFYDFVELPDQRYALVVADVTGKSIPAALMMVMARSILRAQMMLHPSPTAILQATNDALCRDGAFGQYVTAFLGILDPITTTLTFATAGHPFPYLRRGYQIEEIGHGSLPLGAKPDAMYEEMSLRLQAGDQLFLLTDGFFEERNANRELFGFDRLTALIAHADPCDPQKALDEIWEAVSEFRGSREQSDDMTAVVLQVLSDHEPSPLAQRAIPVGATTTADH